MSDYFVCLLLQNLPEDGLSFPTPLYIDICSSAHSFIHLNIPYFVLVLLWEIFHVSPGLQPPSLQALPHLHLPRCLPATHSLAIPWSPSLSLFKMSTHMSLMKVVRDNFKSACTDMKSTRA